MNNQPPSGICIVCGCTATDCTQCIERTGSPCSWTDESETLCTACEEYVAEISNMGIASEEAARNLFNAILSGRMPASFQDRLKLYCLLRLAAYFL